jgi:hypothetical protein
MFKDPSIVLREFNSLSCEPQLCKRLLPFRFLSQPVFFKLCFFYKHHSALSIIHVTTDVNVNITVRHSEHDILSKKSMRTAAESMMSL